MKNEIINKNKYYIYLNLIYYKVYYFWDTFYLLFDIIYITYINIYYKTDNNNGLIYWYIARVPCYLNLITSKIKDIKLIKRMYNTIAIIIIRFVLFYGEV